MREILRQVGFYVLGIISLLYMIFVRNFAEICIQVNFLNFPVFIGEIFLLICLVLSFFVFNFRSIKGWQWGVVFYFAWVILKTLCGYILLGPLALRHAALFYYLIFIFLGFIFYKRSFLPEYLKILIVYLILVLCITKYFYGYWVFTLWVIAFILVRSFSHKTIKYCFYLGLLLAILFSSKDFIFTSRTFTVGNIAAIVFLITALLYIAKIKNLYKAAFIGGILILLSSFMIKLFTVNAVLETISDIKGTIEVYKLTDAEIKDLKPYFVPQVLRDIKLFNPEQSQVKSAENKKDLPEQPFTLVLPRDKRLQARIAEKEKLLAQRASLGPSQELSQEERTQRQEDLLNEIVNIKSDTPMTERRARAIAFSNSMFRIFIWRDMILEIFRYRPILGFSFGKPFRSESMEILYQASGEWERDGWIEPHNSYLNIVYRMGILGVMLIGFLIWQFCRMVKGFIVFKSLSGILLCSILIEWLVAANFLPILELPYNAIPFWALWGVALGYLKELKNKR